MKKIIYLLALIYLSACSSTPKESAPEADNSSMEAESSLDVVESKIVTEEEKPKTAKPVASQYGALNDAIKNQDEEKIYQSATQILAQSPHDLKALNAVAMYNYRKGRFDVSKYLLSKGIAAHPRSAELHSNLGLVYLAQSERRDAVKSFRQALSLNSSDGIASANLGSIYVQEKDYAKAVMALETAYDKGLRDSKVLNNYGVALMATKKFDKAEDVFKAGLKDQNNKELLLNYAILLIDYMNKNQEGLEVVNRLKFVGGPSESRNRINALENKAKAGLQ